MTRFMQNAWQSWPLFERPVGWALAATLACLVGAAQVMPALADNEMARMHFLGVVGAGFWFGPIYAIAYIHGRLSTQGSRR
jgi:hypothetical protein